MNQSPISQQSPCFLLLAVSMITCLILLINVSFKIILLQGQIFTVSSLLCPLIAGLYLFALRKCTIKEQQHLLNISLIILYLFCIGIYILVNLPAAEYLHDNPVYQIIFENIPKKFFATTISFAVSFYIPHLLLCSKAKQVLLSPRYCFLLAVLGGAGFFCIDFCLLFSDVHTLSILTIFIDSSITASFLLLLLGGVGYLFFLLGDKEKKEVNELSVSFPLYSYLICFAVVVVLMCVACEYRIVALSKDRFLAASCIFFPISMLISTIIGESWGYKANVRLTITLMAAQLAFDTFLMGIIAFPSPSYFNLNPFYAYIMPRRLPAASFSIFVSFVSNTFLLHYLKHTRWHLWRPLRILIANLCASSLLCLVDYSVLFGGIYPYEQIIDLASNVWIYKLLMTLLSLPLILWLCRVLEKRANPSLMFK